MRFSCGVDRKTRAEKQSAKVAELRVWHRVFALVPRSVGPRDCRWLEVIERRYPAARKIVGWSDWIGRNASDPYATGGVVRGLPEYRALNLNEEVK